MSFKNLLDEIKKGLPSGSYLLTASDRFLHVEAAALVRDLVPSEERDFNFHTFDLLSAEQEKPSFDYILDVVNTVPFFTGRKYVVVENFQKTAKKDMKKIEGYLQNPSESAVLVLLHEGSLKKDAKQKKAFTLFLRTCMILYGQLIINMNLQHIIHALKIHCSILPVLRIFIKGII